MVKANRERRTLTLPQHAPAATAGAAAVSTTALARRPLCASRGGPLEAEIDALLTASGVGDGSAAAAAAAEDAALGAASVTAAEVEARRGELAKMRSLLFHYERKMKRMKKIKSRRYRRALKREKEAVGGGVGDSDGELDGGAAAAEAAERRRVEERMNLRHKNTSAWVRRQLQRKEGTRNEGVRAAIDEQLRLGRELRHKAAHTVRLGRAAGARRGGGGGGGGGDADGATASSGSDSSADEAADAAQEAALTAALRGGAAGAAAAGGGGGGRPRGRGAGRRDVACIGGGARM